MRYTNNANCATQGTANKVHALRARASWQSAHTTQPSAGKGPGGVQGNGSGHVTHTSRTVGVSSHTALLCCQAHLCLCCRLCCLPVLSGCVIRVCCLSMLPVYVVCLWSLSVLPACVVGLCCLSVFSVYVDCLCCLSAFFVLVVCL